MTNINDYACPGGYRFSFDNVNANHTIVANCECTPNPVYKDLVVTVIGGCRTNPAVGTSTYLQGTVVPISVLPPVSSGQCVVDYVRVNSNTQSQNSFSLTMNVDKYVEAKCSCDYSITINNDNCRADWEGVRWFDEGDHTCVTVGTTDPYHCDIQSMKLDGVDVPSTGVN